MPYIRRLGAIVATMTIIGCGSPSPDSPVMGQVSRAAEALPSTPTSDWAKTGPGVNATVHQYPIQNYPARLTAPQSLAQVALLPNQTDGSCSAPDFRIHAAASPAGASPSTQHIDITCGQREVRQSTASLQAQDMRIDQSNDELAPMTYALTDLESEPEQAHELWLEQVIQEVTEFDTL